MVTPSPPGTTDEAIASIEKRAIYLLERSRRVVAAFFSHELEVNEAILDEDHIGHRELELSAPTLARFAPHWTCFVPPEADRRSELIFQLSRKYALDPLDTGLRGALHLEDPAVVAASRHRFGKTPEELLAEGPPAAHRSSSRSEVRDDHLVAAEAELEWVTLQRGDVLFRQGDPGDALYVVVCGELRVLSEEQGQAPRALTMLGGGELVGEMAVITGRPRSATVEAAEESELVRLSKGSFDQLLEQHPRAMMPLIRLLVSRLERRQESLVKQVVQLTIQIDDAKRSREVSQIVESDFFQELQGKARTMRARRSS